MAEIMKMKASAIKAELKELRVGYRDCFDKEGLADKLVKVKTGVIKPPPIPTPKGAAKGGFEFGQETRQGEDISMEDAFAAAGWTGEEKKDPKQFDENRYRGMNRDFSSVDQSDFKKPYTGPPGRKGRYG